MPRDDSLLNTGTSSASFSSAKKLRTEQREQAAEKRAHLLPAGEIVQAELQKEIDEAQKIDYLNVEEMLTDEHLRSELMARKKYMERLIALKNRFDNMLRDNKHA